MPTDAPLCLRPDSAQLIHIAAGTLLLCEEGWLQLLSAGRTPGLLQTLAAGQQTCVEHAGWLRIKAGHRGSQLRLIAPVPATPLAVRLRAVVAARLIQLGEWLRPSGEHRFSG